MGSSDDKPGYVDSAAHLFKCNTIKGSLRNAGTPCKGGLRLIDGGQVLRKSHSRHTRHKSRSNQDNNADSHSLDMFDYPLPMGKNATQDRFDALMKAMGAARDMAAETARSDKSLNQSEIARRIATIKGASGQQRTIGRFFEDESGVNAATAFGIMAVIPDAGAAFIETLNGETADRSEESRWQRTASRLSKFMSADAGALLADILEEIDEFGVVKDSMEGLKRDARIARRARESAEAKQSQEENG